MKCDLCKKEVNYDIGESIIFRSWILTKYGLNMHVCEECDLCLQHQLLEGK